MFKIDRRGFADKEEEILRFWDNEEIFSRFLEKNKRQKFYSLYDGPPFATGLPHYGHILAATIKDVVSRYKTMQGYFVPRKAGWDCHGLPIESEVEKSLALSSGRQIEAYGIDKFNENCRDIVLMYVAEWRKTILRTGCWVDFDHVYYTMDSSFMESVWRVFGEAWKNGLIYKGLKVMHYSPKLGTPISNFEANLNYQEVEDYSIIVEFCLRGSNEHLLVWTTTPWTLPANLAIAVNPRGQYVKLRSLKTKKIYFVAKSRITALFTEGQYEILDEFLGEKLFRRKYDPIMPYFSHSHDSFFILKGDFVNLEEGTGFVHLAPSFGEEDYECCRQYGIVDFICPIDKYCHFVDDIVPYQGLFVKDAEDVIVQDLKKAGKLFRKEKIHHRYPYCWRTDLPLVYRVVDTWFFDVEKIKTELIVNNLRIQWIPEHIQSGRFGKWLESAKDWSISRNRYWGTPIPVWESQQGDRIVISSKKELEERSGCKIYDLHRHFVDSIDFQENGVLYTRIPEVFDCWFESGSMPYALEPFLFDTPRGECRSRFPADFISEGIDQTRGWFYTLHVLATALHHSPAFLNVIVNGIVLAEDGLKMSKKWKNYPDPNDVMHQYGSDALRLYLLSGGGVRGENAIFSLKGIEGVIKQILLPLWNSYVFLATYSTINGWMPMQQEYWFPQADIDRWILSLLQKLIVSFSLALDNYQLDRAISVGEEFIDAVTNWYIRRNRSRFWANEDTRDRREASETLYTVLLTFVKLFAPFIPFLSELIYQGLKTQDMADSVHLVDFPTVTFGIRDPRLEYDMHGVQKIVRVGHSLRKEHRIKVRQPLAHAYIVSSDVVFLQNMKRHESLIAEELNVKEIRFLSQEKEFVHLCAKPNYRILGKRVKEQTSHFANKINLLNQEELWSLFQGNTYFFCNGKENLSLTQDDVIFSREAREGLIALSSEHVTVILDIHMTLDLRQEGMAREIVNKINSRRKEKGFAICDRIVLHIDVATDPEIQATFRTFKKFIMHEVLAEKIIIEHLVKNSEIITVNQYSVKIDIIKL